MDWKKIEAIRILPQSKAEFPTEDDFKQLIKNKLSQDGAKYCFRKSMMQCPANTLILFQYDGKIRAFGLLKEKVRDSITDDNGVKGDGYYIFYKRSLKYLEFPIDGKTMREAVPEFKAFSQAKQEISMKYWNNITQLLGKLMNLSQEDIRTITEVENCGLRGKEKRTWVKIRINQGRFRKNLISRYGKCCLCNISKTDFLIASHIKPWTKCSSVDKLDTNNGLLLCPNHDALFDKGWISFDERGKIIISSRLTLLDRKSMNVENNMKIEVNNKNERFLKYHREKIFRE